MFTDILFILSAMKRDNKSSNAEVGLIIGVTLGAVALRPWVGDSFLSYTDNTVAQSAMRVLRTRRSSPAMQAMVTRRTEWLFEVGALEVSRRVTSKANVWADVGSRPELGGAPAVACFAGLTARALQWIRSEIGLRA